jgi:hypothetical protein
VSRNELQKLNEIPAVELDRMISAARLAVLEIETYARDQHDARHYYSKSGWKNSGPASVRAVVAAKRSNPEGSARVLNPSDPTFSHNHPAITIAPTATDSTTMVR